MYSLEISFLLCVYVPGFRLWVQYPKGPEEGTGSGGTGDSEASDLGRELNSDTLQEHYVLLPTELSFHSFFILYFLSSIYL